MSDSKHPLYKRGFQRGRAKTEAEMKQLAAERAYGAQWNRVYLALLPTAMSVENWTMKGKPATGGDARIEMARLWANAAVANLKPE